MAFDDALSTAFVKQSNWDSSFLVIHFSSAQKVRRKHCKNILLFARPVCFNMYFFRRKT